MSYTLQLSRQAIRVLDRVDRPTERRLRDRLHVLAKTPEDPRFSKRLVDAGDIRSARVGDWRILFVVDAVRAGVLVLAIRPRGQVYRKL